MNDRAREIATRALEQHTETRQCFLERSCGDDTELRTAVESLLSDETFTLHAPVVAPSTMLQPGSFLGRYEILEQIGAGGMGEVYKAVDTRLGRTVAIKVLPPSPSGSHERRKRFEREARVISQLSHPHICTLHDVGHHDGIEFLVMEHLEGETLAAKLLEGALPIKEALAYGRQIAEGLDRAHDAGIVHRDLKPSNVMLTESGVKLLDFGLAKRIQTDAESTSPSGEGVVREDVPAEDLAMTRQGALLGTVPYMSPEQAEGRPVGALSDQFSFGIVFYEMLCGRRPFEGDSAIEVLTGIRKATPEPASVLREELPDAVEQIVGRCLEKDPARRYETTSSLSDAIRRCEESLSVRGLPGRRALVTMLGLIVLIGGALAWLFLRDDVIRWLERDALAEVERLTELGELNEAFRLVHGIQKKIPHDPIIRRKLERITIPITVVTDPPGAQVRIKGYASEDDRWVTLGETPLEGVRVPYALAEWKIEKPGFEDFVGAPFGMRPFTVLAMGLALDPKGSRPEGMVKVPGGPYVRSGFRPVELGDYWIDRYEVTNRQFKAFMDAGGYTTVEWWTDPFLEDEQVLDMGSAIARFVDTTGRPGSAVWRDGTYPEDQEEFPIGGISWFEASAYCRSLGKRLPTFFHWSAATAQDQFSDIVSISNFGNEGPAAVGSYPGLGDFGTYDMAGNVKEWCWNEGHEGRYILGGAWNEPTFTFRIEADSRPAWERAPANGFRCALYEDVPGSAVTTRVDPTYRELRQQPADDEIFEAYRRMYAYDRSDLDARVEASDDSSSHWRKETVSFKAAYGDERVLAHVFLPKNAEPPYAPVIWFPGNDVFFLSEGEALASMYLFDFLPQNGRALIYPVYKGTYERDVGFSFAPNEWRDMIVWWSKDLSRTVDYLEEREEFDMDRLAYYGFSSGAYYGPIFTAIDDRFKASVLLAGGLYGDFAPEVDAVNFAPRSHVPTLMINGKDDFLNPWELSQKPLFQLLGAPDNQKRHARLDGGHIVPDRSAMIVEILAWLDRYAGPQ